MKNSILKLTVALALFTVLFSGCSKDSGGGSNEPDPSTSLGTFVGNIQVSDDPQTKLGYIYNAKVTVTKSGSSVTIKITGNEGFDREYTGNIIASSGVNTSITNDKQTKPTNKVASGNTIIAGNSLGIDLAFANDAIVVRETPTSATTINIAGKLRMLGSNLVRQ